MLDGVSTDAPATGAAEGERPTGLGVGAGVPMTSSLGVGAGLLMASPTGPGVGAEVPIWFHLPQCIESLRPLIPGNLSHR